MPVVPRLVAERKLPAASRPLRANRVGLRILQPLADIPGC
jgi:hypothetical protein